MEDRRFFDFGRHVNIHEHRVLDFCDPCDGTHAIDVALHEMPTEAVACPERPFQVDAPALFPLADQRSAERRPHGVHRKAPLRTFSTVRQAPLTAMLSPFFTPYTTPSHAVPRRCSRAPRQSCQAHLRFRKHSRRSKTNNVSEPKGRRSTTTQRGASASGNAGMPWKAGSAPSPSHMGDCTQYRRSTQPFGQKFGAECTPALTQQRLDPGEPQLGKGLRERFGAEDAHTVAFEYRHVGHRRLGRRDDPRGHFARRLDQRDAEVEHRAAIEHDAYRRFAPA